MTLPLPTRRRLLQGVALAAAAAAPGLRAQAFPSRPLRLVVGFPPGGPADRLARMLARGLAVQLRQPVIVDNKTGPDSTVAALEVMRARPDGYTLLLGTNSAMVTVPALRKNAPYDTFRDFTAIGPAGEFAMFLVVPAMLPVRDASELLDRIEANPGGHAWGASNSAAELAMLQFLGTRRIKLLSVPYQDDAAALADLAGGRIQLMFTTGTLAPAWVMQRRARALLTLLPRRSPLLPQVPTAAEAGQRDLTITPWVGFFGPAGMPPAVVETLSVALRQAVARPDVRDPLLVQGFATYGLRPPEFTAFLQRRWQGFVATVRDNNLRF